MIIPFIRSAARFASLFNRQRRECERLAVNIAMWYPAESGADRTWVRALVKRAYHVAQSRRGTPHDVLMELARRCLETGFKVPFGTPEEMIPG